MSDAQTTDAVPDQITQPAGRWIPIPDEHTAMLMVVPNPGAKPILTMNVVDGKLVATYEPGDLSTAAQTVVEELMRQWVSAIAENRRFTADVLREVLTDAAATAIEKPDLPQISVDRAAEVMAELMWNPRG